MLFAPAHCLCAWWQVHICPWLQGVTAVNATPDDAAYWDVECGDVRHPLLKRTHATAVRLSPLPQPPRLAALQGTSCNSLLRGLHCCECHGRPVKCPRATPNMREGGDRRSGV